MSECVSECVSEWVSECVCVSGHLNTVQTQSSLSMQIVSPLIDRHGNSTTILYIAIVGQHQRLGSE